MKDWSVTDALIFDMDGTLWDAVNSYCAIWDACFEKFGVERRVAREELLRLMGLSLSEIYREIAGEPPVIAPEIYIPVLEKLEKEMMPRLGGEPFPGVREGLKQLSEKYSVFLLSNCGENGLRDMMNHVGIKDYVTEAVTFGSTKRPKDENLIYIKDKYALKNPVYVGDTQSDCASTHKAGLPFVFASYGFGTCESPDLSFESFEDLTEFFMNLK